MRMMNGSVLAALAMISEVNTGLIVAEAAIDLIRGDHKADLRKRNRDRSRYMPHQGKREIARRLRQAERKA